MCVQFICKHCCLAFPYTTLLNKHVVYFFYFILLKHYLYITFLVTLLHNELMLLIHCFYCSGAQEKWVSNNAWMSELVATYLFPCSHSSEQKVRFLRRPFVLSHSHLQTMTLTFTNQNNHLHQLPVAVCDEYRHWEMDVLDCMLSNWSCGDL
jgi:hypothetical protein